MSKPKTLFEKVWDAHVVRAAEGEPTLLYIDLHLVHEVTSPQAFEGLRLAGRTVRRTDLTFATIDHNIPTTTPMSAWSSKTRSPHSRLPRCARTAKPRAFRCSTSAPAGRESFTSSVLSLA